jgi:hypothetical protein
LTLDPNLKVQIDHEAKTINIRQSAIGTYLSCKRQFYYEYVLGLQKWYPEGSQRPWNTADTGSLFHEMIGAHYLGNDPQAAARMWLDSQGFSSEDPVAAKNVRIAGVMFTGHVEDIANEGWDVGEETLLVEHPIKATFGINGWDMTVHGKIDRLVQTEDGLLIDDWKSVAKLVGIRDYLQQLGRYAVLYRRQEAVLVDRVRSTQVMRNLRQGAAPFAHRPWTPMNERSYASHANNLMAVLEDIRVDVTEGGVFYESYDNTCSWKCRVNDICQALQQGDPTETLIENFYVEKG